MIDDVLWGSCYSPVSALFMVTLRTVNLVYDELREKGSLRPEGPLTVDSPPTYQIYL